MKILFPAMLYRLCIYSLLMLFATSSALASIDSWQRQTYLTYIPTDFSAWPANILSNQKEAISTNNFALHQETMKNYYGYIGHLLDTKQEDKADDWTRTASKYVDQLKDIYPDNADVTAFESMIISFSIAISPIKASIMASGMIKTSKQAIAKDPNCLMAIIARANILYYFPEAFGGDKQEALRYYMKIYDFYESNNELKGQDWRYLFTLSTIANMHNKMGNLSMAIEWAQRALSVEPEFRYVKEKLLPALMKKQKQ